MSKKLKRLSIEEMQDLCPKDQPYYIPGKAYLWVMTYGWAIVGYYIRHENPLALRVVHANHFRNANKDYGLFIREGAGSNCEWRYEGSDLLSAAHIIRAAEFQGEVPHSTIRT